jgi:nucleotide-binding universal stress UspA family protein
LLKARREIATLQGGKLEQAGLKVATRVLLADPREFLVDLARQERVDLVVVGSHGRTGVSRILLGSVANYVVTHSPCNVLVIKLPER